MRRAFRIALAGVAALFLALLLYATWILGRLDRPEVQTALLQRVGAALGAEVHADSLDVGLLRGATLRGLRVANPPPFRGDLLRADALVLRPRLLPLLRGRIEVERLLLRKPQVEIAMNARGQFNYEALGSRRAGGPGGAGPATIPAALTLAVSRLSVQDATVRVSDEHAAPLLAVDDADLDASVELAADAVRCAGQARVEELSLAGALHVRSLSCPLETRGGQIRLQPLQGRLAGGRVEGSIELALAPRLSQTLELDVSGADVQQLLREAGSKRVMSGRLQAHGRFRASGGLASLRGSGKAEVSDCRVSQAPLLAVVSRALQVPELAVPDFDECRAEFSLAGTRATTPVLRLTGAAVQLSGRGSMEMRSGTLDYDLTLALAPTLLAKVPTRELRAAFRPQADGFGALDFHVSGTSDAPRTDILARLGKAAAKESLKQKLFGVFKRK